MGINDLHTEIERYWEHEDHWQSIAVVLPAGVYSDHSVLGKTIPLVIGNLNGRLFLPASNFPNELKLLCPPGPPQWVGHPNHSSVEPKWGTSNSTTTATVSTVVINIEQTVYEDGSPTYPSGFLTSAKKWLSVFSNWLAVCAGGTTDIIHDNPFTWENWNIEVEALSSGKTEWLEPKRALTLKQWEFAANKASSGESAPFPLSLIAAAQRSAAQGDYRRAVFDASSAAEITLREALRKNLLQSESASFDFFDWSMKGKTFGPLIDACIKFNLPLPTNSKQRLVQIRNKIAHPHEIPSDDAMADAVEVATQIVHENFTLDDELRSIIY